MICIHSVIHASLLSRASSAFDQILQREAWNTYDADFQKALVVKNPFFHLEEFWDIPIRPYIAAMQKRGLFTCKPHSRVRWETNCNRWVSELFSAPYYQATRTVVPEWRVSSHL